VSGHPDLVKGAFKFTAKNGAKTDKGTVLSTSHPLIGVKLTTVSHALPGGPELPHFGKKGSGVQLFLHSMLLEAKPDLKVFFMIRDPVECAFSRLKWISSESSFPLVRGFLEKCIQLLNHSAEGTAACMDALGPCWQSEYLHSLCSRSTCTWNNLALLLTPQASNPVALAAAMRFLGVAASFASDTVGVHFRTKNRRGPQQLDIGVQIAARQFYDGEYVALAGWLDDFGLVPGTSALLAPWRSAASTPQTGGAASG